MSATQSTATQSPEARMFKDRVRDQWDAAADGWNRHGPQIRDWLRLPTDAMIEMAGIRPGHHVLDVAAGAGDQTLDIADRVGPSGAVTATDISSGILAFAARNAAAAGHANIRIHAADAERLGLPGCSFDAAVCRLGLMFMPAPQTALSEIRRTLKPGARFCGMVFAGPDANPLIRIQMSAALRHAGQPPRDPFAPGGLLSLGRPGDLDAHFRAAGFTRVATTRMDVPFRLPSTADYVGFIRDAAGPIQQVLAPLSPSARADAWADIEAQLQTYQTPSGWIGPNTLLLTTGQT
jgi:SAM-dependent methyltransferase